MIAGCAAVLSLALAWASVDSEPSLEGRTFDEWSELFAAAQGAGRVRAAEAIATIAGTQAGTPQDSIFFAELVKLLSDHDAAIRCVGIRGLHAYAKKLIRSDGGHLAAVNTMTPLLADDLPAPRIAAARAVLDLDGNSKLAMRVLEQGLTDDLVTTRRLAAAACATLKTSVLPLKPLLENARVDPDAEVRALASQALKPSERTSP